MELKEAIKSQYHASLEMLRKAIKACPESLWTSQEYQNPFWHVAFHVLFYTHFYLQDKEEDFIPWEKHRDGYTSLDMEDITPEDTTPMRREDILDYQHFCVRQVDERVDVLDLAADSGFYWLPFDKLELQLYNIRHIQHHAGELYERLGANDVEELAWIGTRP